MIKSSSSALSSHLRAISCAQVVVHFQSDFLPLLRVVVRCGFCCSQDASLSYDPETPPGDTQSNVVFREGQTLGGHVTHTPRLIVMDLKGNVLPLG